MNSESCQALIRIFLRSEKKKWITFTIYHDKRMNHKKKLSGVTPAFHNRLKFLN
jgi:hypothetical protein